MKLKHLGALKTAEKVKLFKSDPYLHMKSDSKLTASVKRESVLRRSSHRHGDCVATLQPWYHGHHSDAITIVAVAW